MRGNQSPVPKAMQRGRMLQKQHPRTRTCGMRANVVVDSIPLSNGALDALFRPDPRHIRFPIQGPVGSRNRAA